MAGRGVIRSRSDNDSQIFVVVAGKHSAAGVSISAYAQLVSMHGVDHELLTGLPDEFFPFFTRI